MDNAIVWIGLSGSSTKSWQQYTDIRDRLCICYVLLPSRLEPSSGGALQGRINAQLAVVGNEAWLLGGIVEIGEQVGGEA